MMQQVTDKIEMWRGSNALPFTAGERTKGRNTVKAAIAECNGRRCLDCRIWYTNDAGELKPSPKSLTLQLEALPKLALALNDAMLFARSNGLLAEGGET